MKIEKLFLCVICVSVFSLNVYAGSCPGEATTDCGIQAKDQRTCESHYKHDHLTGLSFPCSWSKGVVYGGYCLTLGSMCD